MTLVLTNEEVEQLVSMADCIDAMDTARRAFATGRAVNGPVDRVLTPLDRDILEERGSPQSSGDADRGTAYPLHHAYTSMVGAVEPLGVTAERIDSDGVSYVEDEDGVREVRVPLCRDNQFCGLFVLWDSKTAEPLAFIHDAVAQKMRVAATSALGTKYLAREDASEMALIGTGWQASTQVQAHPEVRDLDTIRVYSRTPEHRREFVETWNDAVDCDLVEASSAREAVEGADVVVAATNSIDPVVRDEWLDDGVFFTGVKHLEFEARSYDRCDRIFVNRNSPHWHRYAIGGEETIPEEARDSEHHDTVDDSYPLVGEVAAGLTEGRQSPDETIGFINKGDGIQFAAIGRRIYDAATDGDVGTEIPTDLFLQGEEYIP